MIYTWSSYIKTKLGVDGYGTTWFVALDKIRTKVKLKQVEASDNEMYLLCGQLAENTWHLFFRYAHRNSGTEDMLIQRLIRRYA